MGYQYFEILNCPSEDEFLTAVRTGKLILVEVAEIGSIEVEFTAAIRRGNPNKRTWLFRGYFKGDELKYLSGNLDLKNGTGKILFLSSWK